MRPVRGRRRDTRSEQPEKVRMLFEREKSRNVNDEDDGPQTTFRSRESRHSRVVFYVEESLRVGCMLSKWMGITKVVYEREFFLQCKNSKRYGSYRVGINESNTQNLGTRTETPFFQVTTLYSRCTFLVTLVAEVRQVLFFEPYRGLPHCKVRGKVP